MSKLTCVLRHQRFVFSAGLIWFLLKPVIHICNTSDMFVLKIISVAILYYSKKLILFLFYFCTASNFSFTFLWTKKSPVSTRNSRHT